MLTQLLTMSTTHKFPSLYASIVPLQFGNALPTLEDAARVLAADAAGD